MKMEGEISMGDLPEGCIATILSLTTPVDACRLSLISKSFCSAAVSDTVWDRFLSSDHFLSTICEDSSLLATCPSKKSLYLTLSDHPIIIDNGKKSFQLDKQTGKKCYMLSARDLTVTWGDSNHWHWITLPDSRFEEVAQLYHVWWFEIRGKMNTNLLSSNTHYEAFLIFKLEDNSPGFNHDPTEMSMGILGGQSYTKNVWLDDPDNEDELERPKLRSDGWLEIEMGEFFNSGLENEELHMGVLEIKGNFKSGFFLEGIEIRPKK